MRVSLSDALLLLVLLLAWWRGGAPERFFAAILATSWAIDRVGHLLMHGGLRGQIQTLHLIIDATAFVCMALVMVRARRIWPIWASACQLLSAISHLTAFADPRVQAIAVLTLAIAPYYLVLAAIFVGVWMHQRRVRRRGTDPSWRT